MSGFVFDENWRLLSNVLEDATDKMTRAEILDEWPEDHPRPDMMSLKRWLKEALAANLLLVEGAGKKSTPYRYWLAEAEARWREDPMYRLNELQRETAKQTLKNLGYRK